MATTIDGDNADVPGVLTVTQLRPSGAGFLPLGNAVSSGSVVGLALGWVPTMVFLSVRKDPGGLSILAQALNGSIGSDGFDFELSAATDSVNYVLDYLML
jgi:hypothetical protein